MPANSHATNRSLLIACAVSIRSVDDGLVDERAHFRLVVDVAGRHELCHVHDDELLVRIYPVRRVIRAAPTELADRARGAALADTVDDVKAEAKALAGSE